MHMNQSGENTAVRSSDKTGSGNNWWNILIKIALPLAFVAMMYSQMADKQDLTEILDEFQLRFKGGQAIWIVVVIALMPVNWILETRKWQILLPGAEGLPFRTMLKAIFGGITLSLFTPNRIGEYAGRVLFVPRHLQWKAVIATVVGSFSQNLVNLVLGFSALMAFIFSQHTFGQFLNPGLGILIVIFSAGSMWLYFNIGFIYDVLSRVAVIKASWYKKALKHLEMIKDYKRDTLSRALLLSFIRFMVFSTQFVLLLLFFGLDIPILWIWAGVLVIYLFHTGIPLPPFVDVLVRSQLALMIWQNYDPNELTVLAGSFFIWIINLVVPALIGLLAIENINVLKSLGYAKKNKT